MLGIGERETEVIETMRALRGRGVDFLTLGQYLQPSPSHLQVQEFITPEVFGAYERRAEEMGFRYVASGPLVRSSYRAGELFVRSLVRERADAAAREAQDRGDLSVP